MRPFTYTHAADAPEAVRAATVAADAHVRAPVQLLGGGTTLLDLMKLDVMRPDRLVDVTALDARFGGIEATPQGLRLGALARMSDAAEHPAVLRDYPVIAESLAQAASAQLRNMARLGGNVLQRTRCNYFRDPSYRPVQQAQSRQRLRGDRRFQPAARRARHQRGVHRPLPG